MNIPSKGNIVLKFGSSWCGPCKQIGPALEELAVEYGDKVVIGKVNLDENPETPTKFGIRSIPTLLLFQDGQVVGTKIGAAAKGALKQWIDETI